MIDIKAKIAAEERNETVSWTFEDLEPLLRYIRELRKLAGETMAVFESYALEHDRKFQIAIKASAPVTAITAKDKRDRNLTWAARLRRAITIAENDCPGHIASKDDPKRCARCGTHIEDLRPNDE